MKPREKKPEIVYRVIDAKQGHVCGSYSRAYRTEFDFESAAEARSSNHGGMYEDREKYKIAKYRVTYELLDPDCDPPEPAAPLPPRHDSVEDAYRRVFDDVVRRCFRDCLGIQDPAPSEGN